MTTKKAVSMLVVVMLFVVAVLSACSNNESGSNTKTDQTAANQQEPANAPADTENTAAPAEEQPKFKDMTIRIMTWQFGEESSFGKGYRAIADDYMQVHPEIKVEFVEQPLDGYIDKLNANLELDSETAIDIAQLQPWMIDQIKNTDKLVDMGPLMEKKSAYASEATWYDTFIGEKDAFTSAKASNKFGAVLFVPSDTNPNYYVAQPIVYNKDYFQKAGITSDPKTWTWSDFIANAKLVQEWGKKNIDSDFTALASDSEHYGWAVSMIGGQFGADLFDDQFAKVDFNSEGAGLDPNADYVHGDSLLWSKISYAITHGWLDYKGDMQKYYDDMMRLYSEVHGLYQEGFEQQSSAESSQLFYTGRVAMMQAHIGSKKDIETNTQGMFDFGVFLPPLLTKENTQFATGKFPKADGQYSDGFGVNKKKAGNDPDRLAAVTDFMQFFTSKEEQSKYVEIANSFSPTKDVKNPEELMDWVFPLEADKTSNEIYGHMIIEWAGGTWPGYVQEYIQGKKTVQQLIEATAKDAKKNVVDWYSAEPEAIQAQIAAKEESLKAAQDDALKQTLENDIKTLKIAKVLYAEAVKAGK
ncbi:ABC transporter substrate-binding protein [Paenibacillus silvisoli]|uniref:ABC transporter substrate-binding protein n=1 Tax=Paenibacillus silvisoli TaxID=3110539 RepID=UPI0028063083|nr:extracellular solute-binding protein [Paenibacillus silvisoli]